MSDIFFCYRRNDNPQTAWHLAHILNNKHKTFLDTHIRGGEPWGDKLKNEITNCTVFLCFIGEKWLERNESGSLRLNDENDIVRQEIELALELKKRILPILVGDATPPRRDDLPDSLQLIRTLEFVTLRFIPPHFYADAAEITRRVDEIIREQNGRANFIFKYIVRFIKGIFLTASLSAILSAAVTALVMMKVLEPEDPPPVASLDRYDEIMARRTGAAGPKVIVGYRKSSAPLSYENNGQLLGFMQKTCQGLIEKVFPDFKAERVEVFSSDDVKPEKGRISAIKSGKIDIECGSTSITAARREQVSFLDTHIYSQTRFLSLTSLGLYNKKGSIDFGGKRVSYVVGTTNSSISSNFYDASGLLPVDDIKDLFDNIRSKKVDVAFLDDVLLAGFLANYKDAASYKISVFGPSEVEQYGIMLPKGSPKLEQKLKAAWDQLMNEGKICQFYKEYFQAGAIRPIIDEIYANRRLNGVSSTDDLKSKCT
jgi:glutamate/aspartate transport system substrate-binding protein